MRQLVTLSLVVYRTLAAWYVLALLAIAVGVTAGLLSFFYVYPGKPKIGVIEVPFTVISENSAYAINKFVNYARRDDSIKAVVIKLSTPGGDAAASERLYFETRNLRNEKPVVISMNGLVASGGYMMAMGASHSYTQVSTLVGNVGVVAFSGPLIPPLPEESVIFSGPYKQQGSTRREWTGMVDQLKSAFAQIVISERAGRLRISEDELVQGRIYSGLDAVRLGLVDEIGGEIDAFRKAAELAGISRYDTVDVNYEVLREFLEDLERISPSSTDGNEFSDLLALRNRYANNDDLAPWPSEQGAADGMTTLQELQELMRYGRLDGDRQNPLPEFPLDIARPNFYYLYVGNAH